MITTLNNIFTWIGMINNIVQFLAYLFALIGLILIFWPLIRPIITLLKPVGFKNRLLPGILWYCRKNPNILIRSFIELAIIRTQGEYASSNLWDEIIKEFRRTRNDLSEGRMRIMLKNCSSLTNPSFYNRLTDYFSYFHKYKRNRWAGSLQNNVPSFLSMLSIQEGFLFPGVLISGLLSRYKDDWEEIIGLYKSSSYNIIRDDKLSILPEELCFTFAWLMWGPSCVINDQDDNYRLLEFAFGDENNSIHSIIRDDENGNMLWKMMRKDSSAIGIYTSINCTLCSTKEYVEKRGANFGKDARYFLDRIVKTQQDNNYLLEIDSIDDQKSSISKNYYCTAYVWIMFEVIDDDVIYFQPEKTVTFFEHANLADRENYIFLINCLIDKCTRHFKKIFEDSSCYNRRYRYCLSINNDVETEFVEQLKRLRSDSSNPLQNDFKNRIVEKPIRSITTVFRAIDDYFANNVGNIRMIEVSCDDYESLSMFGKFYTETYCPSFEDENERESLDSIVDYLKKKKSRWYGKNDYHVVLAVNGNDDVLGGMICDYLANCNVGALEFLAINPKYRMRGHGTRLYEYIIDVLNIDAHRAGNAKVDWLIGEIDNPYKLSAGDATAYLFFWRKMGFNKISFDYIQPALSNTKKEVEHLWLITCNLNQKYKQIPKIIVLQFIRDYARYAMRINNPEENATVRKMICNLNNIKANSLDLESLNCIMPENINLQDEKRKRILNHTNSTSIKG